MCFRRGRSFGRNHETGSFVLYTQESVRGKGVGSSEYGSRRHGVLMSSKESVFVPLSGRTSVVQPGYPTIEV